MGSRASEDAYELSSRNVWCIFETVAQHAEIMQKINMLKNHHLRFKTKTETESHNNIFLKKSTYKTTFNT